MDDLSTNRAHWDELAASDFIHTEFALPPVEYGQHWLVAVDTADPTADNDSPQLASGVNVNVPSRSVLVLRAPRAG